MNLDPLFDVLSNASGDIVGLACYYIYLLEEIHTGLPFIILMSVILFVCIYKRFKGDDPTWNEQIYVSRQD